MLPATVQFIIAMIASALNERLTKKMAYMREEQRILLQLLHEATGKKTFGLQCGFSGAELPILGEDRSRANDVAASGALLCR